jgi:hypothetical protein
MEFMEPCRAMVKPARAATARYSKEYPAKETPPFFAVSIFSAGIFRIMHSEVISYINKKNGKIIPIVLYLEDYSLFFIPKNFSQPIAEYLILKTPLPGALDIRKFSEKSL